MYGPADVPGAIVLGVLSVTVPAITHRREVIRKRKAARLARRRSVA